MNLTQEVQEAIQDAVEPQPRDRLEARVAVLDVLADGRTHHWQDFLAPLFRSREIPLAAGNERIVLRMVERQWPVPDPGHQALERRRLEAAVWFALAELVAEGVVTQAVGSRYGEGEGSVPVRLETGSQTTTTSARYIERAPVFGIPGAESRWRVLHPADHPRTQLARQSLAEGLEDLLGPRGTEVLREAVACFHRGRFLAAADLLAAASEAAWFVVGGSCPGEDATLDRLVRAGENAADVISRTADVIARERVLQRQVLNDVRAHAARLRDIRNYGLHPVGSPDADREDAFTEAGCAALFMGARRYFLHLEEARTTFATRRTLDAVVIDDQAPNT